MRSEKERESQGVCGRGARVNISVFLTSVSLRFSRLVCEALISAVNMCVYVFVRSDAT